MKQTSKSNNLSITLRIFFFQEIVRKRIRSTLWIYSYKIPTLTFLTLIFEFSDFNVGTAYSKFGKSNFKVEIYHRHLILEKPTLN